jgi:hypothetical protein
MTLLSKTFVAGMALAGAIILTGCGGREESHQAPPTQTTMPAAPPPPAAQP